MTASRTRLLGLSLLAASLLASVSVAQTELARLTVDDASSFSDFGGAVAIDGDVALVAAPDDAVPDNYTGSVYVFRRTGSTWVEEAKLLGSDAAWSEVQKFRTLDEADQAFFGRTLALDGDIVVIGAPGKNSWAGAAYLFRRQGGTWVQEEKLESPWPAVHAEFGNSLAVSADLALVGVHGRDTAGHPSGAVYAYRHVGGKWQPEPAFTGSAIDRDDLFASSVALDGDLAIVGAFEDNEPGASNGSASLFDVSPSYHLMVHPLPLQSGDDGTFAIRHGTPFALTALFFSWTGPTGFGRLIGVRTADDTGAVKWEFPIPPAAAGVDLWFQAVQPAGATNVIATEIR